MTSKDTEARVGVGCILGVFVVLLLAVADIVSSCKPKRNRSGPDVIDRVENAARRWTLNITYRKALLESLRKELKTLLAKFLGMKTTDVVTDMTSEIFAVMKKYPIPYLTPPQLRELGIPFDGDPDDFELFYLHVVVDRPNSADPTHMNIRLVPRPVVLAPRPADKPGSGYHCVNPQCAWMVDGPTVHRLCPQCACEVIYHDFPVQSQSLSFEPKSSMHPHVVIQKPFASSMIVNEEQKSLHIRIDSERVLSFFLEFDFDLRTNKASNIQANLGRINPAQVQIEVTSDPHTGYHFTCREEPNDFFLEFDVRGVSIH